VEEKKGIGHPGCNGAWRVDNEERVIRGEKGLTKMKRIVKVSVKLPPEKSGGKWRGSKMVCPGARGGVQNR